MHKSGRLMRLGGVAGVLSLGVWFFVGWVFLYSETPGHAVVRGTVDLKVLQEQAAVGDVIDLWRGVPVRANGIPYDRSVGSHSSASGYYYGRQWQCVEFVKRFYFDARKHAMPDVMGHAKDFFDPGVGPGEINSKRGMRQFVNGGAEPVQVDDLLVWNEGAYGHVAVVCRVLPDEIEVVQQTVRQGSRMRFPYNFNEGYWVGGSKLPAGWLRLP